VEDHLRARRGYLLPDGIGQRLRSPEVEVHADDVVAGAGQ
jgi:hypothetical protein